MPVLGNQRTQLKGQCAHQMKLDCQENTKSGSV